MSDKGFADNQTSIETPNDIGVAEKPLSNQTISGRVDINVLKSKLQESESKEFKKNMTILHICHNVVKRVESPEISPYDQHQLKLHAKAAALISEWSDCVFFTNYKLGEVKVQGKGNQMNTKAVSGDRVIYSQENTSRIAKNRYGLDPELPFDWSVIREQMLAK